MQKAPLNPEINIVGGKDAQEGEYPWMAAIYANGNFRCGGAIVDSRWVVTTAQCLLV